MIGLNLSLSGRLPPGAATARPIYMIGVLGQSNAEGSDAHYAETDSHYPVMLGAPQWAAAAPLKSDIGIRPRGATPWSSLVPLTEEFQINYTTPGGAKAGETACTGAALALQDHPASFLFAVEAVNGAPYTSLAKGTASYARHIANVTAAKALADQLERPFQYLGSIVNHGEADQSAGIPNYAASLATWQADLDGDIKAITGQSADCPLFLTQQTHVMPSNGTDYEDDAATSYAMYDAHMADPGRIVLVAQRGYLQARQVSTLSSIHLSPKSQRALGYVCGRAIYHHFFGSHVGAWRPVTCVGASLAGATITATFTVPNPPLVFDFEAVSKNQTAGELYGFSYTDDSGAPPTIIAATVTGPTTVDFTLSTAPTGANKRLRAGHGEIVSAYAAGPVGGNGRINLRDSGEGRTIPTLGTFPDHNWCTQFEIGVS